MRSEVQQPLTEPSAVSRAADGRALGIQMRLAPTREERTAAARALLAFRKRRPGACEWCGVPFERYGSQRFCTPAHTRAAYRRRYQELIRERDRARHAARHRPGVPRERPCVRCRKLFTTLSETRRYCGQSCRQLAYMARQGLRARPEHPDARRSG
jgi:hypothetical protein